MRVVKRVSSESVKIFRKKLSSVRKKPRAIITLSDPPTTNVQQELDSDVEQRMESCELENTETTFGIFTMNRKQDDEFTIPRKTKKVRTSSPVRSIKVSNHFEALTDEEEETEEEQRPAENAKKQKLPPIIINGSPQQHGDFVKSLQPYMSGEYFIKYSKNSTCLYVKNKSDRDAVMSKLQNGGYEYHTYAKWEEKTHAFVIRGLFYNITCEKIKTDLLEQNVQVIQCYKMTTKNTPLYMITTKNDITLKVLQQKVRYVLHTKVQIERVNSKKRAVQCHRCQMWGHAQSNCYRKPRCHKCAEEHYYTECKKPKDSPAKCVNCGNDHPASSIKCEAYLKHINRPNTQNNKEVPAKKTTMYVLAPPPTVNVWEARARGAAAAAAAASSSTSAPVPAVTPTTVAALVPAVAPAPASAAAPEEISPGTSSLKELRLELNKLNSIINLNAMIKSIRFLTTKLAECLTPLEKLEAFQAFNDFAIANGL